MLDNDDLRECGLSANAVVSRRRRGSVNKPMIVGGIRTIPDFRWPEQRLVIEADSRAWHEYRLAREDDAERQARLEAAGERVIRVTWQQTMAHPRQTLARINAAGAPSVSQGPTG